MKYCSDLPLVCHWLNQTKWGQSDGSQNVMPIFLLTILKVSWGVAAIAKGTDLSLS